MVDRIDAVGGTLTIESRPGHGTVVRGAVPRAGEPR
jgi:signal transduction histidine kinase